MTNLEIACLSVHEPSGGKKVAAGVLRCAGFFFGGGTGDITSLNGESRLDTESIFKSVTKRLLATIHSILVSC